MTDDIHCSSVVHGNCAFTVDMLEATVAVLEERLDMVRAYLTAPDIGYGLSPIGVINLLNLVNGETG